MTPTHDLDYAARRRALAPILDVAGVETVWLPIGSDLEYLTGLARGIPSFGDVNYTHGWAAGAFFAPGRDPVFVLPRHYVAFDLPEGVPGELVSIAEFDDADAVFARVVSGRGGVTRLGIGARTWGATTIRLRDTFPGADLVDASRLVNRLRRVKSPAEVELMREACRIAEEALRRTTDKVVVGVTEMDLAEEVNYHLLRLGARTWSFDTAVWSMGPLDERDATVRISLNPLTEGTGVSFDFGSVFESYCSDFGRTIHVGEPNDEYRFVYETVMAAQRAGIEAVRPGVTAAEVDHATRRVIVASGYGEWFRHRTGHCIGLDVHEEPFISEEDATPLESGMTFTIEPSVYRPGRVGVRVEDVILCTETGGEKLNQYPTAMVVND